MKRKILYSPGFGAGWTTWNTSNPQVREYLLTYQPIIDFLEAGGKFTDENTGAASLGEMGAKHPLLVQLERECKEKFGADYVCVIGADDLRVKEVNGRVRIHEYDGSESVEEEGEYDDWM